LQTQNWAVPFPPLVNKRAFLDLAWLAVNGALKQRQQFGSDLQQIRNFPILGEKSLYARAYQAVFAPTGNAVSIKYGRENLCPNVPPLYINLRSVQMPITEQELKAVLNAVLRPQYVVRVSRVELTFDVDLPWDLVRQQIWSPAHREIELKRNGFQTIYRGSTTSGSQLRVYDRRRPVTRIELIMKRGLLKASQIENPSELARIRQLDLTSVFGLREFDPAALPAALASVHWARFRDAMAAWAAGGLPVASVFRFFGYPGHPPQTVLRGTPAEQLLWDMKRKLVW